MKKHSLLLLSLILFLFVGCSKEWRLEYRFIGIQNQPYRHHFGGGNSRYRFQRKCWKRYLQCNRKNWRLLHRCQHQSHQPNPSRFPQSHHCSFNPNHCRWKWYIYQYREYRNHHRRATCAKSFQGYFFRKNHHAFGNRWNHPRWFTQPKSRDQPFPASYQKISGVCLRRRIQRIFQCCSSRFRFPGW